ncbi:hypothetical protein D6833_02115, partial [Candidatus Parcubacteria bacterium]
MRESIVLAPFPTSWETAWKLSKFEEMEAALKCALSLSKEQGNFPGAWKQAVKQVINRMQVPGFSHAWKAPAGIILQTIKKQGLPPAHGSALLKFGVLVWCAKHQDLVDRVRARLEKQGYLWATNKLSQDSALATEWAVGETLYQGVLSALKADFLQESDEDLALAIWANWRHCVFPDEQLAEMFQKQQQQLPAAFREALEHLQDTSAESEIWEPSTWEMLGRFIEAVVINKRLVRGLEQEKKALQEALANLQSWQETYPDITLDEWNVDLLPQDQVESTLQLVDQLTQSLKTHQSLVSQPPAKISEQVKWSQQIHEQATRIQTLIRKVNEAFSGIPEATPHTLSDVPNNN